MTRKLTLQQIRKIKLRLKIVNDIQWHLKLDCNMKLINSYNVLRKMKRSTRKFLQSNNWKKKNIFKSTANYIRQLKKLIPMMKSFNWNTVLKFKSLFSKKERTAKKSGKDKLKMNSINFNLLSIKNLRE